MNKWLIASELQDNLKCNDVCIIRIPEGEEEQGIENLFEKVMIENFSNLMRKKVTQIQETPNDPQKRKQRGSLLDTS